VHCARGQSLVEHAWRSGTVHCALCSRPQKLGIPTEIGDSHLPYYETPIEDMSHGESIHIMPGVNRRGYRETDVIVCADAARALLSALGSAVSVLRVRVLQRKRGARTWTEPGQ
jgi:hypothetical protein